MVWPVKREPWSGEREVDRVVDLEGNSSCLSKDGAFERRALRTQYRFVKHLISSERDDISLQDSMKFKSIFMHVEALHENVKKPWEQVADAQTLLGIASTLGISVRSQNNEGVTLSDFITAILKNYSHQQLRSQAYNSQDIFFWADIGIPVSHILESVRGCCSMIGPMSNEIKQQKRVYRKRTKPTESTRPEEIDCEEQGPKTDTDSNMLTMFDILKKRMRVGIESLLLNRLSFAQTVENIFALSFLVKDGRAEITVDDNGRHLVSPRNGPSASAVASGVVLYHHFVFRFDFKDWKLMMEAVEPGELLMPHRGPSKECSRPDSFCGDAQHYPLLKLMLPHIPRRPRNRGLIVKKDSAVDDTMEKVPQTASVKGKSLIF